MDQGAKAAPGSKTGAPEKPMFALSLGNPSLAGSEPKSIIREVNLEQDSGKSPVSSSFFFTPRAQLEDKKTQAALLQIKTQVLPAATKPATPPEPATPDEKNTPNDDEDEDDELMFKMEL